jgi:lipopolysaccharide transport system permease protein
MLASKAATRVALFDFIWTLVRTDFKVRYHDAFGGFIWALMKPVAMFVVLYRVFHFLFHGNSYMMNLLVGLFLWSFFSEATPVGLASMLNKRFLITRASFPRWIIVVTSLSNALLTLSIYSVGLVAVAAIEGRPLTFLGLCAFGLYLLLYVMIVAGFSLGTSVLFLEYRDLDQVWDLVLQAGFFLAPIIYPLETIPERYHFWLYLWPVTPVIQFSRMVLLEGQLPSLRAHLLLMIMAAGVFVTGALIYVRRVPRALEKL